MSLAEDLQRLGATSQMRHNPLLRPVPNDSARKTGAEAASAPSVAARGADATKRVEFPRQGTPSKTPDSAPASDASLELIDRASKGVMFLVNRYKHLEDHIKQLDAWSTAQIQAAEEASDRWKEALAASERKLEEVQRAMELMVRRTEAAEQVAQRDREALGFLQDRIISAFGFGSEAHEALTATIDEA